MRFVFEISICVIWILAWVAAIASWLKSREGFPTALLACAGTIVVPCLSGIVVFFIWTDLGDVDDAVMERFAQGFRGLGWGIVATAPVALLVNLAVLFRAKIEFGAKGSEIE